MLMGLVAAIWAQVSGLGGLHELARSLSPFPAQHLAAVPYAGLPPGKHLRPQVISLSVDESGSKGHGGHGASSPSPAGANKTVPCPRADGTCFAVMNASGSMWAFIGPPDLLPPEQLQYVRPVSCQLVEGLRPASSTLFLCG